MKTIVRIFLFSVGAAFIGFWPAGAGAAEMRAAFESKMDRARVEAKAETARQARALASPSVQQSSALGKYVVFDAPGAAHGTFPTSINLAGAITGYFVDASQVSHGFLRTADGAITPFDVPFGNVYGANPASISLTGAITGSYNDSNGIGHGFVRAPDGIVATFDAPGGVYGTYPLAISLSGEVVGYLGDANFLAHGFIRAPNGKLTTFDPPGAGANPNAFIAGTFPVSVNAFGTIAGGYANDGGQSEGFLRSIDGAFTEFAAPGNIYPYNLYGPGPAVDINLEGVVAGAYFQPIAGNPFGGNFRAFIRALDGAITTFDAATYSPCCIWTFPTGINPENVIVGVFNDGYSIDHGFLRAPNGSITTFDAPGAGVGFNQGTAPLGITALGEIVGIVLDSNRLAHGFILTPQRPSLSAASR
jgi:hypothetical protein